jgi:alkanesulfonate monooxygenase SsuD/methylene tetrahydromethanopterin reductase-like flavin-dependent oxidoreductase (luciferase family)
MKYGLTLPITGGDGDLHKLVELAVLAEEAGWDGVLVEDYIVFWAEGDWPLYDPWVALAAIAARTERIRLCLTVTPLSRRRPWKVAREAVTLDHLSNGRFTLGIGLGDLNDRSFGGFGEVTDPRQRAERLDEALGILVGLWSGEPFSYQGKHFRLDEVTFLPRPVQQPRIPIWVGGGWPKRGPARRAARWDGMIPYALNPDGSPGRATPDDIRAILAFVERERGPDATTPFDLVTEGRTPGDDPEQARAIVRPFAEAGLTWWIDYAGPVYGPYDTIRRRIEQGPPSID